MKLTPKAIAVLTAPRSGPTQGIGARQVAHILGYGHKYLRAGQYAGKLRREGWLQAQIQSYRGKRGYNVYSHMSYFITMKGRLALADAERRGEFRDNGK